MKLEEAIEQAAKELPEGVQLALYVENGAAWVRVEHEDGSLPVDGADESLTEQILSGIRIAKAHASNITISPYSGAVAE